MSKPFTFGVAASGENFTDREAETARLTANFRSGVNTILISPRRWGKTSLVQKVCKIAADEKLKIVYFDIFACRNENDFYNRLAAAIIKQTSTKLEEWVENIKNFLLHVNPKFSFGQDPINDFSLSIDFNNSYASSNDVLQLPEKIAQKKGIKIVICIDEFQQIGEFKDSVTVQKKLRSVWQLQQNVSYCLFGSKQHLMNELFDKPSLPFYKFGDVMHLKKIDTKHWVEYIQSRFNTVGKKISAELAADICEKVDHHSSYVQQLSWLTLLQTADSTTAQNVADAYDELIAQCAPMFEPQIESLSGAQINYLRAMCDGTTTQLSSAEVIKKYNLNTSANAVTARNALIKKELISYSNKTATFTDPILAEWLKRRLRG
jgi:hypothetical protein